MIGLPPLTRYIYMCKKSEYTIVAKQCVQCMFYRDLSIVAKELMNA